MSVIATGIYEKDSGKVIEFAKVRLQRHHQERPEEDGEIGLPKRIMIQAGAFTLTQVNSLIHQYTRVRIQLADVQEFIHRANGKICVYRYDMPESHPHANDCHAVPNTDKNGAHAAKIARWFCDNPTAFGDYCVATWNCEHFATYCHITTIRVSYLNEQFPMQKGSVFPRSVLCKFGKPWSRQADRLFGQRSNILKKVEELGEYKHILQMDVDLLDGLPDKHFDTKDGLEHGSSMAQGTKCQGDKESEEDHLGKAGGEVVISIFEDAS